MERDLRTLENIVQHNTNIESTIQLLESSEHSEDEEEIVEIKPLENEDISGQNRDFLKLMETYAPSFEKGMTETIQDEQMEKQILTDQLDDERKNEYESMSVPELRYELHKKQNLEAEEEHVEFMKSVLLMILTLIEFVNKKLKLMNLNGWSNHVSKDLKKHEKVLKLLHVRYFKKSFGDPVSELGWTLAGSMVLYHFSNANNNTDVPVSDFDIGTLVKLAMQFL